MPPKRLRSSQAQARKRRRDVVYNQVRKKRAKDVGCVRDDVTAAQLQELVATASEAQLDLLFSNLDQNVSVAKVLYYLNSGYMRFDQFKEYGKAFDGTAVDVDAMCKEVAEEALGDDELKGLLLKFREQHDFVGAELCACAACGIRDFVSEKFSPSRVRLVDVLTLAFDTEDMGRFARMTEAGAVLVPIDKSMTTKEVHPWNALSFYYSNMLNLWFHVHPELVVIEQGWEWVMLCPTCEKACRAGEIPRNSIAHGVDFGWARRIGLEEPNLWEQMILAQVRMYTVSVKIARGGQSNFTGQRHRGNAICFLHDAPEIIVERLCDPNYIREILSVYFVDANGDHDNLAKSFFGTVEFCARAFVLKQWLIILRCLNEHYAVYTDDLIERIVNASECAMEKVKVNINRVDHAHALRYEREAGSDVAQVQQHDERLQTNPVSDVTPGDVPMRTTFVVRTNDAVLQDDDVRDSALLHETSKLVWGEDEVSKAQVDEMTGHILRSRRWNHPVNEFERDESILGRAFATVFMTGKAYNRSAGSLNHAQRNHLLKHFTCVPARNMRLLGYVQDAKRRHAVVRGVNVSVKGSKKSIHNITALLERKEIREQFEEARKKPTGAVAKSLLKTLMPFLNVSGKNVQYGATQGSHALCNILEAAKRYGPASSFLTLAFDDKNNPRALRTRYYTSSNNTFPNVFREGCEFGSNGHAFIEHLTSDAEGVIDFAPAFRAKCAIKEPVSYVIESKSLIFDVLTYLLKLTPEKFFSVEINACMCH